MKVASVLAKWTLSSAEPAPSSQSRVVSSVALPSTPFPNPLRLLLNLAAMQDMFYDVDGHYHDKSFISMRESSSNGVNL
jgi:hypothetical protein